MSSATVCSSIADFHSYVLFRRNVDHECLDHPLFETYIYLPFLALRSLSSFLFVVSYEDTELLFEWKKDKGNKEVLVSEELEIPQFILTDYWTEANFSNFTSGKLGACTLVIRLVLHFELPENFSLVRR